MNDLSELKIRTVVAGLGLGVILLIMLVVVRELYKVPPLEESAIIFPMFVILIVVALVSWFFAFLALVPVLQAANTRASLYLESLESMQDETYQIVTDLANESKQSRDALNEAYQALEVARQTIMDLQSTSATAQTNSSASTEAAGSSDASADTPIRETDFQAQVANVVVNLLAQVAERAKTADEVWQRIVEGQAQMAQSQQNLVTLLNTQRQLTKRVPQPIPRGDTQEIIYEISVERVTEIRQRGKVRKVEVVCNEHSFSFKQFKKHVPQLVDRWEDLAYQMAWQYDSKRQVWYEVQVPQKNPDKETASKSR